MSSSDPRDALGSMFNCLQDVFKKYDRSARKKAWNSLQSGKGKNTIDKLLNSPTYQVVGVAGMVKFKEWLANEDPNF